MTGQAKIILSPQFQYQNLNFLRVAATWITPGSDSICKVASINVRKRQCYLGILNDIIKNVVKIFTWIFCRLWISNETFAQIRFESLVWMLKRYDEINKNKQCLNHRSRDLPWSMLEPLNEVCGGISPLKGTWK